MEELIVGLVTNAPATAVLLYLLYMVNGWGKELIADVREIKSMLEHTREERRLSEAAQAQNAVPLGRKTR